MLSFLKKLFRRSPATPENPPSPVASRSAPKTDARPSKKRSTSDSPRKAQAPQQPRPPREPRRKEPNTEQKRAPRILETKWDPTSFVVPPVEGKKRFHDFNLPPAILHGIADMGFQYCTPIQAESLQLAMDGKNVAGKAQTGTGKTAAFLVSTFRRLLETEGLRSTQKAHPAALILGPTRELVIQIAKDADEIGKYTGLRCVAVYGGMDYSRQEEELRSGTVDIVAATPGRLIDFVRSHVISLSEVRMLVIDEADRMLDMGFIPDVSRIVRQLPGENDRQTMLFSATLNDDIMRLATRWMPNPVQVSVETESVAAETIHQIVFPIRSDDKFKVLYNFLQREKDGRTLIFCNRKVECERLQAQLADYSIKSEILSGDVAQNKRLRVLEDFRSGALKIVVATDVAGRGIHVDDVAFVVNYDFPYEADDYVHRIGRTGRAGHEGTAISFACEDESFIIPDIEKLLGEELPCQMPDEALMADLPHVEHTHHARQRSGRPSAPPHAGGFHRSGPPRGARRSPPRRH